MEVIWYYLDWGNESIQPNTLKKPAFTPNPKKSNITPEKPVVQKEDAKFNFIAKKEVEKKQEELKKRDEIPLEMLEIIDSDVLSSDA